MNFIWQAAIVLVVGFFLLRIVGKKTTGEMTGLEIITLLSMASMIGHAVSGNGLLKTVGTLCIFVTLLLTVQYLSIKSDRVEKLFMGKATPVIKDGKILSHNLKKLRMSVDQLEAKLREKGITTFADVKTATIEISGQLGYELMRHAKPVTIGELELLLSQLPYVQPSTPQKSNGNLFDEVLQRGHQHPIPKELE